MMSILLYNSRWASMKTSSYVLRTQGQSMTGSCHKQVLKKVFEGWSKKKPGSQMMTGRRRSGWWRRPWRGWTSSSSTPTQGCSWSWWEQPSLSKTVPNKVKFCDYHRMMETDEAEDDVFGSEQDPAPLCDFGVFVEEVGEWLFCKKHLMITLYLNILSIYPLHINFLPGCFGDLMHY